MATTEKTIAACRIHRVRINETRLTDSVQAPISAPMGKPMNSRSKNSEGMMKNARSRNSKTVNKTVANDRINKALPNNTEDSCESSDTWDSVTVLAMKSKILP